MFAMYALTLWLQALLELRQSPSLQQVVKVTLALWSFGVTHSLQLLLL
jgi:hypothetical protein